MIKLLVILILAHYVADFVFQSNKMAINKSKSLFWLFQHGLEYTLVFSVIILLFGLSFKQNILVLLLLNGGIHFIIDFVTSKITSFWNSRKNNHNFFVTIGFDQMLHYITIFLLFIGIN